ncbi:MAG TPA: serine/threonine-protein kinase, partial [Polyangia bacterium]|nr:serine/threonine-protein kinase [Polyangia bacterium]
MAELSDPRIGTLLEGRYRLDQRLAAGGMGVVYKGELVAIGKPVAIKFLHDALAAIPDLVKRFQREATAMSRLAHPHLVSVVDSGLANGVPFLVMDFVSGRSLADVLAGGPLPAARAVGLTRQILAGVKHAHGMGVVHRDLKPDNILVMADVEEDFVKILDFGLAKVVSSTETQLTNTGFAMGTPGYMSPEQARGTEADERSDLYGVGVILFHMVTGRKPFVADSPLAVLRMHMDDAPPSPNALLPRSCSPELERVILQSLAKEPSARWQTAADFAQALAQTPEAAGQAPPAIDDVPPARLRVRRARARLIGRVVVACVLAAGVVGAWSHLTRRQQQNVRRHVGDAVKLAGNALDPNEQNGPTAPPSARSIKSGA